MATEAENMAEPMQVENTSNDNDGQVSNLFYKKDKLKNQNRRVIAIFHNSSTIYYFI